MTSTTMTQVLVVALKLDTGNASIRIERAMASDQPPNEEAILRLCCCN